MKICRVCKIEKEFSQFYKSKKDGLQSDCKECQLNRQKTPENKQTKQKYYQKEEIKEKISVYNRNPDRKQKKREYDKTLEAKEAKRIRRETVEYKQQEKEYRKRPKTKEITKKARELRKQKDPVLYSAKTTALTVKRNTAKLKRTPKWLTEKQFKEIEEFYLLSQELRWLSEEDFHIDHIVPLQGKNVSGLHVPWNLQILPQTENNKKLNKFDGTYDNNGWRKS